MIGLIDIGSNTVRLNIYETNLENINLILSKKNVAGLVNFIEDKYLTENGILKLLTILKEFKDLLTKLHITNSYYFATASLRNIKNIEEVLNRVKQTLEIDIRVLSGEEEGELSNLGAKLLFPDKSVDCIDIGGGSTELVFNFTKDKKISFSMGIGSLNLHHQYSDSIFPNKKSYQKITKRIRKELKNIQLSGKIEDLVGIGGSIRLSLEVMKYLKLTSTQSYSYKDLKQLCHLCLEEPKKIQKIILELKPERIHTFVPGLLILNEVVSLFEVQNITVSQYGVREGVLISILKGELVI